MLKNSGEARAIRLGILAGRGESARYISGDYRSSWLFHEAMERTEQEMANRNERMSAFRRMDELAATGEDTPEYRAAWKAWLETQPRLLLFHNR